MKVESALIDEQVLFLSDIVPIGDMGAEMCNTRATYVAVWGAGGNHRLAP